MITKENFDFRLLYEETLAIKLSMPSLNTMQPI